MDDSAQDELRRRLSEVIATKPRDEWVALLAGADTCVSPVLSATEVAASQQSDDRGLVATAKPFNGGDFPQLAPLLAGAVRETTYSLPDRTTTDTDAVLADCGLTPDEIAALRSEGAIA
jgi:alpha-methylacyl-CoA racemase